MLNKENSENNDEIQEEETTFEPDAENAAGSSFKNKDIVADLRAKLKKAEDEKREYLTGWQRAKADFINTRKKDEEDNKLMVKFAEAGLLSDLVPVLDSFDLALAAPATPEVAEWRKGIEQIRNQLMSTLKERGLEIIDPLGKPFDTREAEAVGLVDSTDPKDDDKVMDVFQKGYKLQGRVLRPAKVRVGKFTAQS